MVILLLTSGGVLAISILCALKVNILAGLRGLGKSFASRTGKRT